MRTGVTFRGLRGVCAWSGWLLVIGLSALVIVASLPYLRLDDKLPFLLDKGALASWPLWRAALTLHIAAALLALASAPPLCSGRALRWSPRLHRVLGRLYVGAVLGAAAPTALFLAPFANGGRWGALGFGLLAGGWFVSTAAGLGAIRRGRLPSHVRWMFRSYAFALSTLSFRVAQLGFFFVAGLGPHATTIAALWLSLALSLLGGELAARRVRGRPPEVPDDPSRDAAPDQPQPRPVHLPVRGVRCPRRAGDASPRHPAGLRA